MLLSYTTIRSFILLLFKLNWLTFIKQNYFILVLKSPFNKSDDIIELAD